MLKPKLHIHVDAKNSPACQRIAAILFEDGAVRAQYEVSMSMAGPGFDSEQRGRAAVQGLDPKRISGLNGMLELAAFFRKQGPDIVQVLSSELSTMAAGAARLVGAKLVVHTLARGEQEKLQGSASGKLSSSLAADKIAAASDATRRKLASDCGLKRKDIPVTYADIRKPAGLRSAQQLRARLGLPADQLLFAADMYGGSASDAARVIKVVAALRSKIFFRTMPMLALCGLDNSGKAQALHIAAQRNLQEDIVFYGNDEAAREAAAACDVFVAPCAGFGDFQPAILTAMSEGRTVIAARGGMMPELVESSKSGLLVKPADEESLYRALELVINDSDLKTKMGYAAKNRFDAMFSTGSTARAYLKLYAGD